MKKKGHYFFAFVIICIGIYFTAESFSKTEYISQGKNVGTVVEVWSKAIAASVNNEPIGMYIDGNTCIENNETAKIDITTQKTGGSSPCVTEGTLVTLADGTQKPVEQLTYADEILVFLINPSIISGAIVDAPTPYSQSSKTCNEFLKLAANICVLNPLFLKISCIFLVTSIPFVPRLSIRLTYGAA